MPLKTPFHLKRSFDYRVVQANVSRHIGFLAMRSFCLSTFFMLIGLCLPQTTLAQANYPPKLPEAVEHVYKSEGDVELRMWVYQPANHDAKTDSRPAIVFFFGGGWKAGSPAQFESHCRYLASRGMVAATADYRVSSRHGVKADACVEDAKSAVRWLRSNAAKLGVDPGRICAAGGSAGGHTACCTALIKGMDAAAEDVSVSSVPNAMALFNPAVMIAPLDNFTTEIDDAKYEDIASRTGVAPETISPIHHVRPNLPPTIIFHGKADPTVPYSTVAEFTRRMADAGNRCELKGFAEAPHGFFNAPKGNNVDRRDRSDQWHRRTLLQLDTFLQSMDWLTGSATVRIVDQDFVSLRGNYTNSFQQFSRKKTGHVAFLGGSITEMNGYRPMICDWLTKKFPDTKFTFTNAGIASTCSNTGAFRLQRDVLSKGPVDLLFVEFAVNDDQDAQHSADGCVQGMEGVIRHARMHNPNTDIVMTHFVNEGMLQTIKSGNTIKSASQHEKVARHYGVSSSYLSKEVAARIASGKLTWKAFGGTHPGPIGNQLAADQATAILTAAWKGLDQDVIVQPHPMPKKRLLESSFAHGFLQSPDSAANEHWKFAIPAWAELPGGKRERFTNKPMLSCTTAGQTTSLQFDGTAIGAFVVAGPDAGQMEVKIDDGEWKAFELFHRFSKGLHYPRTVMFATDLPPGSHNLTIRLATTHHAKSKGTAARIIGFAVNGMMAK